MQESGTPQPSQETGPGGGASAEELFTVDQLAEISQNPDPLGYDLAGDRAALVPEMKKGGIVTKNQIAAFLANICQETDWLKTLEEYGDEDYYRSFLGDEWMYHGRGYIMNTWLDAYQRLSDVLGVDLVSNPDLLAQDKALAAKAAVWYWNMRGCGPVADQEDFVGVCSLINRGENPPQGPIHGWEDRLAAYERAKAVIGTGTEPATEPAIERSETEVTEEPEVANNVLVYTDDDAYIRARENDAYVWMLQGSNTPAKANANGYIYVPGLPGAGPDAAALAPTEADKLVTAADADTWLRTAPGGYIQGEGMSDHDLQANLRGWLWDRTAWEAKPKDDRFWPVADTPPDPNSWNYVDQHPTRYIWVPSVEKVARDLCNNFPVWCNTYYHHPPPEIVGGVVYDTVSMDVWNPGGRGDTLDGNVHIQVRDYVMNDQNPPWLAWVCSFYNIWTPAGGWQWYSNDTNPATDYAHVYHLHLTFALDS